MIVLMPMVLGSREGEVIQNDQDSCTSGSKNKTTGAVNSDDGNWRWNSFSIVDEQFGCGFMKHI